MFWQVSGRIVEFFGDCVSELSVGDRMAIAQMSTEAGVAAAFFPPDHKTAEYFRKKQESTSKDANSFLDAYFNANSSLFQSYGNDAIFSDCQQQQQRGQTQEQKQEQPIYETVIEMDVREIVPSATGPRGASHRVPLDQVKEDFDACKQEVREGSRDDSKRKRCERVSHLLGARMSSKLALKLIERYIPFPVD